MTDTTTRTDTSPTSTAAATAAKLQDTADDLREQVGTAVSATRDEVEAGAEEFQKQLIKAGEKAREVAEKQPLMVAAGALAVGVALGLALGNRRD